MKKIGMALLLTGVITTGSAFADAPKAVAQKACRALVAGDANTAIKYMSLSAQKELKGHMNKFKGKLKGMLVKGLKKTDCKDQFLLGKGGGISRFVYGSDLGFMIQEKDGKTSIIKLTLLED